MKGSFTEDNLSSFMNNLMTGGVPLDDLRTKPVFKKADKWDGKDAPPLEVSLLTIKIHNFNHSSLGLFQRRVMKILSSSDILVYNESCIS